MGNAAISVKVSAYLPQFLNRNMAGRRGIFMNLLERYWTCSETKNFCCSKGLKPLVKTILSNRSIVLDFLYRKRIVLVGERVC